MLTAFNTGKDMAMSIEMNGLLKPQAPEGPVGGFFKLLDAVSDFFNGPLPDGIPSEDLGLLLDFDANEEWEVITKRPCTMKGVPVITKRFMGWKGTFEFARTNSAGDYLAQFFQDAYVMGKGEIRATITQVKIDPNGKASSSTTWRYEDSVIVPRGNGKYQAGETVVQTYEFYCPQRAPVVHTGRQTALESALIAQISAMQYVSG